MEWNIGTVMAIGMRVITHRSEVERVGRKLIGHIVATEEIFTEVKALLNKIVPELIGELSKAETTLRAAPEHPAPTPPPQPQRPQLPMLFGHDPRSRRGRPQFR